MSLSTDLVKSIRGGKLDEVVALLDAGAPVELDDARGHTGLPLAMACFLGHAGIVRELVRRGAKVNLADNKDPASPLSMALRGNKRDIVKLLIELGAVTPEGMQTGLSENELILARLKAEATASASAARDQPVIEEIQLVGCYGTDTTVLEADVMRAARQMAAKNQP